METFRTTLFFGRRGDLLPLLLLDDDEISRTEGRGW